jgi:biotin transport system substrate-specific component
MEITMQRHTSLAQAAFGELSLLKQALMVLAGTALIAVAAQISVPMLPVPMTLQTCAVLFVGFAFGSRLGMMTVLAYLAEGAMGLPVFANGGAGLPYMMGPTGGFLMGFVLMAGLAGLVSDYGLSRNVMATVGVGLVASALVYVPGLAWPALAGAEWTTLWASWAAPFLLGDVVKAVIVALVVSGGLRALNKSA